MQYYHEKCYGVHYWKGIDGNYCTKYCTVDTCPHMNDRQNTIVKDKSEIMTSCEDDFIICPTNDLRPKRLRADVSDILDKDKNNYQTPKSSKCNIYIPQIYSQRIEQLLDENFYYPNTDKVLLDEDPMIIETNNKRKLEQDEKIEVNKKVKYNDNE
jgi:hypothetical protein